MNPDPAARSALGLLLALGLLAGSTCPVRAHELFTAYIQHRIAITVGRRHVDVTVQLTFFENSSNHERQHMDTNQDGRVSDAEVVRYLEALESGFARDVSLRLGPTSLELIPLTAPRIDLLGNDRVERGHHQLILQYFAPTPEGLFPGKELIVEDRLWPGVRALGAVQVEGRDGYQLEAIPRNDPVFAPLENGEAREFKTRFKAVPMNPKNMKSEHGRPHEPETKHEGRARTPA